MSNITTQSLTSLVDKIKNKELSSEEVTKAFIDRSEKSQELNSYISEDFSNAIDKAKKFDQNPNFDLKLPGIPMAVKDLFCTENVRTTAGSKILENFVPTYESTVTQNIWNEGAILLGKLNCDEFAMGSSNETSYYGNVQNPIDKGLVPSTSCLTRSPVGLLLMECIPPRFSCFTLFSGFCNDCIHFLQYCPGSAIEQCPMISLLTNTILCSVSLRNNNFLWLYFCKPLRSGATPLANCAGLSPI